MGDARNPLDHSRECDIAIIGAGIGGALIADALIASGRRIVMLDARDVAQGSTAATTALLQYEIDTHLADLAAQLGAARALLAYQACASTFGKLEQRYPDLLRLANYQRRASLYLAANSAALPALRVELAARRAGGFECEWLEEGMLETRFGCRRPGAILSALGAELDPWRFTQGLVLAAERHGVAMFARTRVTDIAERAGGLRLTTEAGHTVDAGHVVVAAGFESLRFLGGKVAEVVNTYALVTEPLADRIRAATLPLIWESARPYLYMRTTPDGRLMLGGADIPFEDPQARDLLLGRQMRRLGAGYRELFGTELPPVACAWGGTFAATPDGLPYIGPAPDQPGRLLFALCFGGNGITFSLLAGEMIRAAIEQRTHELADVFGFARTQGLGSIAPKALSAQ